MAKGPDVAAVAGKVLANIEKVILGKRGQISLALVASFCEGHILLEDVPGVAKTMLARALARSVGCSFKRIQCTPDLLPTDVTGASIFNKKTVEFVTHRLGPPCLVIATQNPVDHELTFPLPVAQLDRFLMRFNLGYPTLDEELKMLEMLQRAHPIDS